MLKQVALRKESVDRNTEKKLVKANTRKVALRKESVDRNCDAGDCTATETASLSARRAWIEITLPSIAGYLFCVALRKESVDRNRNLRTYALNR